MQAKIINPKNLYYDRSCTIVSDGYGPAPCECGHHRSTVYGWWVKFEDLFDCEYFIPKSDVLVLNNLKEIIAGFSGLKFLDIGYGYYPYSDLLKLRKIEKINLLYQINRRYHVDSPFSFLS